MNSQNQNNNIIEHVFRYEYGKIIALLTHKFGTSNIEKIEDSVQDALLKAMQVWGYKDIPKNPTAWLLRVSSNNLIDIFRKDKKKILQEDISSFDKLHTWQNDVLFHNEINDSQLKMIFACCNPSLSVEYQIVLSLKLIGGFSNKEISQALLKKEDTVAKSFTRAKRQLRQYVKTLEIPIEMGLASRIASVLKVIYLLFTEGYKASSGEEILKKDICFEAIRLALLLLDNKNTQVTEVHALISLMCFHTSRFEARIDANNQLVDLEHQDRTKYDKELIALGIDHLELATDENSRPSLYHLQAAVSYHHCIASNFKNTDWENILHLYDLQLRYYYSPIIELNRVVPFYKIHGIEKGLDALERIEKTDAILKNAIYYAIKAELFKEKGVINAAIKALDAAINLSENEMQKKYLIKKRQLLILKNG